MASSVTLATSSVANGVVSFTINAGVKGAPAPAPVVPQPGATTTTSGAPS